MDDAFVRGLQEIKKVDPLRALEGLYLMFGAIERMGLEDLVAAKRTLDVFTQSSTLDEPTKVVAAKLNAALTTRGAVIIENSHYGNNDYTDYERIAHVLWSAFGSTCHNEYDVHFAKR